MIRFNWIAAVASVVLAPGWTSAQDFTATDRQPTPAELATLPAVVPDKAARLIQEVKAPFEFDVSIFATPPAVNYPVFVAAAPDGTLYVSSDGNGSLDRKPHLGRVLRVRDTNDDGQADEVKAFLPDIDSPRGLVWDHDRLYLLHPPDISVFFDRDGDGVAEERKTLVHGIAFTFKDRPADHSSNGLELGIDGWLYAAIGDFGFLEATGADGKKLQLRGGGVVRVRPDGSDLELWADGTRNILEVAVSPLLDGFARDNTNDGGGWDVRLHHFSGLTQHGYPRLFKNFADEIIPPLADYGGGSGCGAAWIDETDIPARWNNAPFTADWGREVVYQHRLTSNGATFVAEQKEFLRLPRVTDLDVDGHGNIYAASWKGASFTWVGPDVGFIVRLSPKGIPRDPIADLDKRSVQELAREVGSTSHRRRLAAQRALLRRESGLALQNDPTLLLGYVGDAQRPLAVRIAAVFGLKQGMGRSANNLLERAIPQHPELLPWILRALADRPGPDSTIQPSTFVDALKAQDPRARKESLVGMARLHLSDAAPSMIPLLADPDPIVAHTAVQTLIQLRASAPCLAVLDRSETPSAIRAGALRVLQSLHEPQVVAGLMARLEGETEPHRRAGLIIALCRLHFMEGPWKGDSWGTRPDTRGPYYQPEPWSETTRIQAALDAALDRADGPETALLGREFARHRIPAGKALEKFMARARDDASLLPSLAAQLADSEVIPPQALPLLTRLALAENTGEAARAQAVIALTRSDSPDAWNALLAAYPSVQKVTSENNLAEKARSAVLNAPHLDRASSVLATYAAKLDGSASLLADGLLLKLASRKVGSAEAREAAALSLDTGWTNTQRRIQILRAATQFGDASRATSIALALEDSDPEVVKAARDAVRRLRINPAKLKAEAGQATIGDLPVPAVIERATRITGDPARGEQLFAQLSCVGCHTVKAGEPLKGPYLGTIAATYRRHELAEAILLPNKTLAQGFVTQHFELKDGTEVDGFVVQEAADAVTIRTVTAQEQRIPVDTIATREKQQRSLMPEGLAAGITVGDLASLLDYLQSLAQGNPTP
jgi:putative membrane-bound dehydrogenase-like protein